MTKGLVRYQKTGDLHFVTFSCHGRKPYLGTASTRELFERALEAMRVRYEFRIYGYVVMPEHVHLLMSEPAIGTVAKVLQALKLSVSAKCEQRPFWLARYYDFNVFAERKRLEKLDYMHFNPVMRGLVAAPDGWAWSSCVHHLTGERGTVEIESEWTAARRDRATSETQVSEARPGAPAVVPLL